jgi:hypothetical protein
MFKSRQFKALWAERGTALRRNEEIILCAPWEGLSSGEQANVKPFYEALARACKEATGRLPLCPCNITQRSDSDPDERYKDEHKQISKNTSLLIVVVIGQSWDCGVRVGIAYENHVPVLLVCAQERLSNRQDLILLRGHSDVKIIPYTSNTQAVDELKTTLQRWHAKRW